MKRNVKNCGECNVKSFEVDGVVLCQGNEITDFTTTPSWCEIKNSIFIFDDEGDIAIMACDGIVSGYLNVITGDEPRQYMDLKKNDGKWTYEIIKKIIF